MKNKFLIYTSNPKVMPRTMDDVISFAKSTPKFYIANVELNPCLAEVKAGDHIITKKGNNVYVIKAITESADNWNNETQSYVDSLTREYALKKANITAVEQIIKFETWCKSARPLVATKPAKNEMSKNSIKDLSSRLKEMFMPQQANDVRIAMTDGSICVATSNGYVSINDQNELTSYPEELMLDLPVYVISKPKEQLQIGDVIATEKTYAKVTKIEGSKISAITYTGTGRCIHTIKDLLFNQTMVRVVVSLAGNINGTFNPMLLALMAGDKKEDSMLPLLLMSQQNGAVGMNPMLMYALAGKGGEESSLKDILLLSSLSGNANPFAGLFGAPVAAPVAAVKPARKPAAVKKPRANKAAEPVAAKENAE